MQVRPNSKEKRSLSISRVYLIEEKSFSTRLTSRISLSLYLADDFYGFSFRSSSEWSDKKNDDILLD